MVDLVDVAISPVQFIDAARAVVAQIGEPFMFSGNSGKGGGQLRRGGDGEEGSTGITTESLLARR